MEKHTWVLICPQQTLDVHQTIHFQGDEHHYAVHVLRLEVGASVQVTNGQGQRAQGRVAVATKKQLTVEIESLIENHDTLLDFDLHLWLALPKMTALETIVPMVAELGCRHLHVFRGEKSLSKQSFSVEKWQRAAWESLRVQHGAWAMDVSWHEKGLAQLLEVTPKIAGGLYLWCDEKQKGAGLYRAIHDATPNTAAGNTVAENANKVVLLIGPEGSFSPAEVELIKNSAQPWTPVSLGSKILKTSTACVAAVATASSAWREINEVS
jgi:16S rRNA (uracil1498-N3)-methyltransferase